MSKSSHPIIEFIEVSKLFNDKIVLDNVNLKIKENQLLGLVGISGAGKTTLFRLLLQLYEPDKGKIEYKGKKITTDFKQVVGFASQEGSFYPKLTIMENLEYFGKMYGLKKETLIENANSILETIGLVESINKRADKLSGGMKRRLDFAIALIHNPQIIIFDEPTTGLDVIIKDDIWALINKIHKLGKTIIISSHNLVELEQNCQKIIFVKEGQVSIIDHKLKSRKKSLEKLFRDLHK
jgi:ABC-2 type transport system ATP-binding protein